jgi:hypothetical protein
LPVRFVCLYFEPNSEKSSNFDKNHILHRDILALAIDAMMLERVVFTPNMMFINVQHHHVVLPCRPASSMPDVIAF